MSKKPMAPPDDEDLDALIDKAVDTFFVEAPTIDELDEQASVPITGAVESRRSAKSADQVLETPSFDEALDTLFSGSFAGSGVSSGDDETDRAIDLAVDTLFVEEPEIPPPETAQLEVGVAEAPAQELDLIGVPDLRNAVRPQAIANSSLNAQRPAPTVQKIQVEQRRPRDVRHQEAEPKKSGKITGKQPGKISYDDVMAQEIERHMHTLYDEAGPSEQVGTKPVVVKPAILKPGTKRDKAPLRKLQEAILTLEWEISKRSVSVLANEIHRVRIRFQDNVTVDFAALSMRIVLEYIVKRMSRAHPESIRFLLEVTDYLEKSLKTSEEDPLKAFHHILTRYEKYKSSVRRAEGLADAAPVILRDLEIRDSEVFAHIVEQQARTLMRAGKALARRLNRTDDPENLIRSFRFLVNRSINRVLESTLKDKARRSSRTKNDSKRK